MRDKAELVMLDDEYTFVLQDGTIIEREQIGWIVNQIDSQYSYERFTSYDALFILDNKIECEIEMMDEFTNPEEYYGVPLYEGERKPRLYRGKVIIHYK